MVGCLPAWAYPILTIISNYQERRRKPICRLEYSIVIRRPPHVLTGQCLCQPFQQYQTISCHMHRLTDRVGETTLVLLLKSWCRSAASWKGRHGDRQERKNQSRGRDRLGPITYSPALYALFTSWQIINITAIYAIVIRCRCKALYSRPCKNFPWDRSRWFVIIP